MTHTALLLVEDDGDLRRLYTLNFTSQGYAVTAVADGAFALHVLAQDNLLPDLVVTDYHLPDMTGAAITRAIRADIRTVHLPVLIISADCEAEQDAQAASASAFLVKPVQMVKMQACLEHLLENRHGTISMNNILLQSRMEVTHAS